VGDVDQFSSRFELWLLVFFKQKTAYEIVDCDWRSDVCSSDLIIQGPICGIKEAKTLRIANSKNRCKLVILDRYELELSKLFDSICLSTLSCSAASSGLLPLLASGVFTNNCPPTMVFDKHSHYSMNHIKAACADEAEVITAAHNDLTFIEDL